ncbi:hypothetical protein NMY22_g15095 [Coprinellus aureogranulatus]|nr:hypothetical protein NMY22_g15095 [Coprinellus aureogranulatus]
MQLTSTLAMFAMSALAFTQGAKAAGGFSASCSNYFIENNHFLRATCADGRGGQVNSALDLNACIGIDPTKLVCRPKCAFLLSIQEPGDSPFTTAGTTRRTAALVAVFVLERS